VKKEELGKCEMKKMRKEREEENRK